MSNSLIGAVDSSSTAGTTPTQHEAGALRLLGTVTNSNFSHLWPIQVLWLTRTGTGPGADVGVSDPLLRV